MDNPELFQVTIVFGNFETREEAAQFREQMQQQQAGYTEKFISGRIRGSWS